MNIGALSMDTSKVTSKNLQQTTSYASNLNQPQITKTSSTSLNNFERNSSVPPILRPSINNNSCIQNNYSIASSYEDTKDPEHMTSCSPSSRGSSPAVVCNSPTAGKRTNYTKAGSAPRSNFSINAVASSQVGKMSPLARYGSLKRVYNKEQERLNPNGINLLQSPESMIQSI